MYLLNLSLACIFLGWVNQIVTFMFVPLPHSLPSLQNSSFDRLWTKWNCFAVAAAVRRVAWVFGFFFLVCRTAAEFFFLLLLLLLPLVMGRKGALAVDMALVQCAALHRIC